MWENSLIFFTSDHGDGATAHKWAAKLSLYEESAKIPMVIVYPGKIVGSNVDDKHLVSQTDLLPTMLEFANIQSELVFTGESLKPIIEDRNASWRNYLVTELADFQPDSTRKGRMLRTPDYEYNIYSTGEEQLFNLKKDPGEMNNLANNDEFEAIRKNCRNNLKQWAEKTKDHFAKQIIAY